jgi:hypothetical protein
MKFWFQRAVLGHRWAAFLLLGLAFFGFGAGTLNLFFLLRANAQLLAENGWQAVMDGGLRQLVELLLSGYAGMACYLVFKACEYSLVRQLAEPSSTTRAAGSSPA